MRKIKFKLDNKQNIIDIYSNIRIKYEDLSISSINGGGNCSFVAESGIEVSFDSETKRVGALGGYIGELSRIKNIDFKLKDNYKTLILCVDDKLEYNPGVAYSFKFSNDVRYDKNRNTLLFGNYLSERELYQIFNNAFIQLNEENELTAIIITEINLNKEKDIDFNL